MQAVHLALLVNGQLVSKLLLPLQQGLAPLLLPLPGCRLLLLLLLALALFLAELPLLHG